MVRVKLQYIDIFLMFIIQTITHTHTLTTSNELVSNETNKYIIILQGVFLANTLRRPHNPTLRFCMYTKSIWL